MNDLVYDQNSDILKILNISNEKMKFIRSILSEKDQKVFNKLYGEDLDNPVYNNKSIVKEYSYFCRKVIPKIKKIKIYLEENSRVLEIFNKWQRNEQFTLPDELQKIIYSFGKTPKFENILESFNISIDKLKFVRKFLIEKDRELFNIIYGEDLDSPVYNNKLPKKYYSELQFSLIAKVGKILEIIETDEQVGEFYNKWKENNDIKVPETVKMILNKKDYVSKYINIRKYLEISDEQFIFVRKLLKEQHQQVLNRLDIQLSSNDYSKLILTIIPKIKKIIDYMESNEQVRELYERWQENNDIEVPEAIKKLVNKSNHESKYNDIHKYLGINNEQLIFIRKLLKENYQQVFNRLFGEDLNNPLFNSNYSTNDYNMFNTTIINKVNKIINYMDNDEQFKEFYKRWQENNDIEVPEEIIKLINKYNHNNNTSRSKYNDINKYLGINNEQLIFIRKLLKENHQQVFNRLFGENLNNPLFNIRYSTNDYRNLSSIIIPKIKKIIDYMENDELVREFYNRWKDNKDIDISGQLRNYVYSKMKRKSDSLNDNTNKIAQDSIKRQDLISFSTYFLPGKVLKQISSYPFKFTVDEKGMLEVLKPYYNKILACINQNNSAMIMYINWTKCSDEDSKKIYINEIYDNFTDIMNQVEYDLPNSYDEQKKIIKGK